MNSRSILAALDAERKRQGFSKSDLSLLCGNGDDTWSAATIKGSTRLKTLLKVCDALDVEIILVNERGVNIF